MASASTATATRSSATSSAWARPARRPSPTAWTASTSPATTTASAATALSCATCSPATWATGVEIAGASATDNKVKGNIIGLAAGGGAALGNGDSGVEINAAVNSVVGGNSPVEGNIISANGEHGVRIHTGAAGNTVRGNTIGLNLAGTADRGNSNAGVLLDNAADNIVGGVNTDYGNLIAGNTGHGVLVQGGASNNNIRYNRIGLDANGAALPNDGAGVRFNRLSDNWVGDNTIANNAQGGVIVMPSGQMNRIRSNSIYQNTGLGIDLDNDGVTPNNGAGDPGHRRQRPAELPGDQRDRLRRRHGGCDADQHGQHAVHHRLLQQPAVRRLRLRRGADLAGHVHRRQQRRRHPQFHPPAERPGGWRVPDGRGHRRQRQSSEFAQCVEIVGCPDPDVDNDNDVDVTDITLVASRWNNPASTTRPTTSIATA